jgi:hypothetical protein
MDKPGYVEVMLRFVRTVLLIDAVLAGVVALIIFLLGWRRPEAYGTALKRTGMIILLFACFLVHDTKKEMNFAVRNHTPRICRF